MKQKKLSERAQRISRATDIAISTRLWPDGGICFHDVKTKAYKHFGMDDVTDWEAMAWLDARLFFRGFIFNAWQCGRIEHEERR